MKFTFIVGSHRPNSQSAKVAGYLNRTLLQIEPGSESATISLAENPLPLWSEEAWEPGSALTTLFKPYADKLEQGDAYVIVSPEWAGMAPAALKNLFLLAGNTAMANKPALLVGVSASRGGSYPIAELRMSSYKNTFVCYIPEHLIVRGVEHVMNDDRLDPERKEDYYIKQRGAYALKLLARYAEGLKLVRQSGVFNPKEYPFGM